MLQTISLHALATKDVKDKQTYLLFKRQTNISNNKFDLLLDIFLHLNGKGMKQNIPSLNHALKHFSPELPS